MKKISSYLKDNLWCQVKCNSVRLKKEINNIYNNFHLAENPTKSLNDQG